MKCECMTRIEKGFLDEVLHDAILARQKEEKEFAEHVGIYLPLDSSEREKYIEIARRIHNDIIKDLKRIQDEIDKMPVCKE